MPCMEVWGGNQAVDRGVIMSGLDAWLYSRPYRGETGGGDVHYVSSCSSGRVTRMLVADVSGHGAEVAETGAGLRQLMRRYINHIDQTRFIASLNQQFGQLHAQGRFATSVVATFFAPTSDLTLSNAGHPPPLRYSARDRAWSLVEAPAESGPDVADVPLGIIDATRYGQQHVRLRVGDLVLFYTDSLTEASNRRGQMLGPDGLIEIVRTLDASRPEGLIGALLEAIGDLAPGNLQADDVTVLLIRPNGLSPRLPLSVRILAPLRMLAGVAKALWRRHEPIPWPQLSLTNIGGVFFDALNRRWRPRGGVGRHYPESSPPPPKTS